MPSRRMLNISPNPSVTSNPVRAPLRSIKVLVPTVLPCPRYSISGTDIPWLSLNCRKPVRTAVAGLSGVDGTLLTII